MVVADEDTIGTTIPGVFGPTYVIVGGADSEAMLLLLVPTIDWVAHKCGFCMLLDSLALVFIFLTYNICD